MDIVVKWDEKKRVLCEIIFSLYGIRRCRYFIGIMYYILIEKIYIVIDITLS